MEYGLLFTIYGLVFGLMLSITLIIKKRKKNLRSRLYSILIDTSIAYAFTDLLTIGLLYILGKESVVLRYVWNIRSTYVYVLMVLYGWYLFVTFKKLENMKMKDFLKHKANIGLMIYFGLASILSITTGKFPGFEVGALNFTGGRGFITTMAFPLVLTFVAFIFGIKKRKESKKLFNLTLFFFVALTTIIVCQMSIPHISFLPFLTIIINYIIYHNVENPDIELLEEVTQLKGQIDKSSNAKTDFLFNLSYDLINPMNAIVSLSQSLVTLSVDNKEEIHRDLKSIKYAGNTLLDSIDNILELSETDEQDNKINVKEYGLYELLKRLETVALTRIGAKQIAFELDIADNLNSKYQGDITKIQKALLNIINNAAKYTDIGKIKLTLTFTPEKEMHMLQFKISDTGCGIKDEAKSFIFSDNQETSGVGLALTKRYIEAMNGTLSFDSVYGAGTTFFVNIPQKPVGAKLIAEDKQEDVQNDVIEYIDCSNYKALIVDDDTLDIKVTTRLIEKYKFQITVITSSLECIDRIKQEEQFDILFLDHKMPELDGMETMKVIKGLEGYKIPRIVALTANAVAGAREYYLKEGFDEYLSKPIDTQELDKIIAKFFKNKQ